MDAGLAQILYAHYLKLKRVVKRGLLLVLLTNLRAVAFFLSG